ncbi:hypothetical protein [Parabacteroides pacaensis]|uniref:hypothetical protein n=1 Tax=Parabacteroides pacaensis TaxID=2086575 RepID=UPI000D107BD5|nr:hypothetical protein [Parabacteroides pacaensis]
MAKTSGGVRTYKNESSTYRKRQAEAEAMRASGKYSSVEMGKGGGYVAIEKSPVKHKPEEMEAAKILADKGYKVVLKNEAGFTKTPDGYLFKASFEQRTPQGISAQNFKKALGHATNKNADVLVAYMKGRGHTRQSVEDGIRKFEEHNSKRFKQIIVVTENGKVHRHKHNS